MRHPPLWLQQLTYPASEDRALIAAAGGPNSTSGLAVTADGTTMTLTVAPGWAVVPAANLSGSTLCRSDANETITLAAAPASGSNRTDLVIVRPRANDIDGGTNNDWIVDQVTGTVGAGVPAVPSGCAAIVQVAIPGGSAAVTQSAITDRRAHNVAGVEPAATAGTAIQSFTDPAGIVWVAKPGGAPVYNGAWRRARDVIHAKWSRSAAFTVGTGYAAVGMDTVVSDPYGLYVAGSNGFVAPVAGKYLLTGIIGATATASGQWFQGALLASGAALIQPVAQASSAVGMTTPIVTVHGAAAGDVLALQARASGSLAGQVAQPSQCWFAIDYLGTG